MGEPGTRLEMNKTRSQLAAVLVYLFYIILQCGLYVLFQVSHGGWLSGGCFLGETGKVVKKGLFFVFLKKNSQIPKRQERETA